jgi:hypothetical protein
MIHQTVLEISNPFDCEVRGHGYCMAKFLILGSTSGNPQYIIRQYHTGMHTVVDMKDLREYGNPSAGELLTPKIPEEWTKKS